MNSDKILPKVQLTRAQIHLTNKCNLRCKFCEIPIKFANTKDLSDEKWIEIVNELNELKVKEITISGGGEPTLRLDLLIKILKITGKNNIKTGIITNGSQVTKEYARMIVEVQPDEWRTSICSPDRKVDAFLRGKDLLEKSLKGISYIAEWKKKKGSNLPKLEVWMVQTRYNIDSIGRMIKKACSIGANSLSVRMVNPPGSQFYPTEEQRKELVKKAEYYKKFAEKLGLEIKFHFIPEDILPIHKIERNGETNNMICMFPFHEIVVFADGRVAVCCNFITYPEDSIAIENVMKKSLKEIWFGEKFNNFRKRILNGNLPDRCRECTPDFKSVDREYKNET